MGHFRLANHDNWIDRDHRMQQCCVREQSNPSPGSRTHGSLHENLHPQNDGA